MDWEQRAKDLEAAIRRHQERWATEKNRTKRVKIQGQWYDTVWGFTPSLINEELWRTVENGS